MGAPHDMIKWALNFRLSSPKGYANVINSRVLKLPGLTTLRDYTHWTRPQSGFSAPAIENLMRELKWHKRREYEKCAILAHDEMKISSDFGV